MIHWSVTGVLNHSVTGSNSEECFSLSILPWLHIFWLDCQLGLYLFLLLNILELIENNLLFNFSVLEEHIECGLPDWHDMLKNIP